MQSSRDENNSGNDHLNGVLFVEKLSPLKRRLVKKKLQKAVTL